MGAHVECEESATGSKITKEWLDAAHEWYCSQECCFIAEQMSAASKAGRITIRSDPAYSTELVKYDAGNKAPLELDNGGDMMDLVCTSYATPSEKLEGIDREADDAPEDYDFSKPYICYIAPACSALGTTVPSG
eukprot:jgi/Astpho2/4521/Aster-x1259